MALTLSSPSPKCSSSTLRRVGPPSARKNRAVRSSGRRLPRDSLLCPQSVRPRLPMGLTAPLGGARLGRLRSLMRNALESGQVAQGEKANKNSEYEIVWNYTW